MAYLKIREQAHVAEDVGDRKVVGEEVGIWSLSAKVRNWDFILRWCFQPGQFCPHGTFISIGRHFGCHSLVGGVLLASSKKTERMLPNIL